MLVTDLGKPSINNNGTTVRLFFRNYSLNFIANRLHFA